MQEYTPSCTNRQISSRFEYFAKRKYSEYKFENFAEREYKGIGFESFVERKYREINSFLSRP